MTGDNPYKDVGAFTGDKYWPIAEAKIPILDWGFLRSYANQDTVSVWNGMFFLLEDHLDRFLKTTKNCVSAFHRIVRQSVRFYVS